MPPFYSLEDRINHPPHGIARCRELIAVAVAQIDGDPIVGDRLVDPALEITVANFKKIIALQRAGRRNPMTHENAEDLTANVHIGRSVMHRSTIGFARHRCYACTATVDKIAQPMGNLAFCCGSGCRVSVFGGKAIALLLLTGFPSRRILCRHATRNAAVLAMNDSRHGTAQPGLIFGIELREFFFADVFNVLFHVFWVRAF